MVRHVLVIGAGIGGLACALACAQAGLQVQVLEARATFAPLATHIDVVPNMLRDLARLGVGDDCVRAGFAYHGIAVVDEAGRQQFELSTPRLAGEHLPAALGMAFDRLHAVLQRAVLAAGATIRMDSAVVRLDVDAGRASLADGTVVEADLVVLTAGSGSNLVEQSHGQSMERDVAQTWWHALIPRPTRLDRTTWMVGERSRRLILVPVGLREAGVAIVDVAQDQGPRNGAAMSTLLAGWGPFPRRLAALVSDGTPTALRTCASGLLAPPWTRGAVLVAAGSCHAIAFPFGQSAAQAMEDAVVLGDLLSVTRDRDDLLGRYMDRRLARASRVHALTRQAARWSVRPDSSTDLVALADELGSLVAMPA